MMAGFLFFDSERRLCMSIGEETIRPGLGTWAVVWAPAEKCWSPPTLATYCRPAAEATDDPDVLRTPAYASRDPDGRARPIWPLVRRAARP